MKVAMITGASSGIGAAVAAELHGRGWRVGLIARREDRLKELVAELGDNADFATADVSDEASLNDAVSALESRLGPCDLMFANDVSQKDIGFNSNYNQVSIIDKKGNVKIIPKNKKSFIAKKIAEILLDKLLIDDRNTN